MLTLNEARQLTFDSFNKENYFYSNEVPFKYNDFIDGMAWTSILCGACYLYGDFELAHLCEGFISNLLIVGPDARTYAPIGSVDSWQKNGWKESRTTSGFIYKEKPQSFAGPAGLYFAIKCGAKLELSRKKKEEILKKAKGMTKLGSIFGLMARSTSIFTKWTHQHINSFMLAYLIQDNRPAGTMRWMCEGNPFYEYINKKECSVEYPSHIKLKGETIYCDKIQSLKDTKPSAWIFRRYPKTKYVVDEDGVDGKAYTPIWQVVGEYLQGSLKVSK